MEAKTKIRWLSTIIGVCLLTIGLLGYYAWMTKDQMSQLQAEAETNTHLPDPGLSLNNSQLPDPGLSLNNPQSGGGNPFIDPQIMNPSRGAMGMPGSIQDFQKRVDDMINRVFSGQSMFNHQDFSSFFGAGMSSPEVSVTELSDEYQIIVKVPEGQSVELNTEVSDNVLKISGEMKDSSESNTGGMIQKSYSSSHFSQTLSLSEPVIESAMKTEHEGNDIVIHIPKQKS